MIVLDVDDEFVDEEDGTGLTEEGFTGINNAVSSYGDIIDIGPDA